jgi:hypothetical protein
MVVAVAFAVTTSWQVGDTDSLQIPPARHVPASTSMPEPAAADSLAPGRPGSAGQPGSASFPAGVGSGGSGGSVADPARPAAAPQPSPAPRPPAAGSLVFESEGNARVQVRLATSTHPELSDAEVERSGRYAGVWIVDGHGTVVGAVLDLVNTAGKPDRRYSTTPAFLPAGTYTAYVVGDGPARVRIPLRSGEKGLAATATRAVRVTYATTSHTMGATETSASLRLHLPTSSAVGFTGGYMDTPGGAASTVSVCLPHRDAACASGDPQRNDSSQLNVGGGYGVTFVLTPSLLDQRRDVLLTNDVYGSGTEMTCWSFTVARA